MSGGVFFMADQILEKNGKRITEYFDNPGKHQEFSLRIPIVTVDDEKKQTEEIYNVPVDALKVCLDESGYKAEDYSIDEARRTISIRLKENVYPFHIVGTTTDGEVKEIAVNGRSGKEGLTIRQVAELAQEEGLARAGIIDQGTTVRLTVGGEEYGNPTVDKDDAVGPRASSIIVYGKRFSKNEGPNDDSAMIKTSRAISKNPNDSGGIDLDKIRVTRRGKTISVQFDQAMLDGFMQGDFEGFTPMITDMTAIQSPWPLLGVRPSRGEVLVK